MKKTTFKAAACTIILLSVFLPQVVVLSSSLQQPETAWVVWETDAPIQRVAWDGGTIWAGAYKGGLSQWQLEAGQVDSYTTANGLSGNHVTSIAVDGSGKKWLALLDGSLNNTVNGSSFVNLTPTGVAGENAWDVTTSGNDVWLATLGGGVSHYSGGSWLTYNTSNSALPHNDVYAVAVDSGGTPWVGTVNYGVAALENGDWVAYSLPVQIENPASPGTFVSNQAVVDIAVDPSGNKWFATDGSGVARLDSSNTNWTVYDTSNPGLDSDFIQSIHIDALGNLWFGTLSGGVSRLSVDGTSWLTYNSGNTPLPEDDILDIATDSQGGLWLAAYDSGLAYYGSLPASPPTFELDLFQKPEYTPGNIKGYYLWVDPDTYEWTLAWSGDGLDHSFTGEILADADLTYLSDADLEAGDTVNVSGNSLTVNASEANGEDSVTFKPALDVTELTIRLMIDGAYYPYNIHLGAVGETPGTAPFKVAAVQPVPPTVTVPADFTVNEGDYVVLTGEFTDPDTPTGHTINWDLGDGTTVPDELIVGHIYPDEGSFSTQLTVTDSHGLVDTGTTNITVDNVAPDADFFYYPFDANPLDEITFTGYFYDPGTLDTHTIGWDFGDGTTLSDAALTVTHTYQQTGTYTVALTVTDDDGGIGTASFDVEIANAAPQFDLGADVTIDEGLQLISSVAFTDPDSTQWNLDIDYGDGSDPVSTTLGSEGNIDLDHIYADDGVFTLMVSLTDDGEAVSTDTLTVTVENMAPVVTLNATDAAVEGTLFVRHVSITDPGTDTWTVAINYGDGSPDEILNLVDRDFQLSHTYIDDGTSTITINVTDDDGAEGNASSIVTASNSAPLVLAGADQNVETGIAAFVDAVYTDLGVSDTHTATIDWGDGNVESGTVTVTGPGAGQVTGQHIYSSDGTYEVEVCVLDDDGDNGCDSFDVLVGGTSNFPSMAVLDDFNRANGAIGSNWWGYAMSYAIASNQLDVVQNGWGTHIYWDDTYFGGNQEVFVTVAQVDTDADEQDLLLKAQDNDDWTGGVIEIAYSATNNVIQVVTYDPNTDQWTQHGADISATLYDGDQFGARAKINGDVEVYINGALIAMRNVSSWPYYTEGGYIGLWFSNATDALLDDFGGGSVTGLLDDFNRANGSMGSNWSGYTSGYDIASNQLHLGTSGSNSDIYWSLSPFGADQEVYVTLSQVDTLGGEQDLLLKAQSSSTWGSGVLEVWYDANNHLAQVWTYEWPGDWVQHGEDISVTFVDGDQFGARAFADGTVEVLKNGEVLATRDVTSWSYYDDGGYIGLWFIDAEDAILDDFGGGTIPGSQSQQMTMATQSTDESSVIVTAPDSFNMDLSGADTFWQGIPLGANQEAIVTFTELNKTAVMAKPLSNGVWGENVVHVLYDVPNGRLQLWVHDEQNGGWVQFGNDILVDFADGDTFRVRARSNGRVEIFHNGKSVVKYDVTSAQPAMALSELFQLRSEIFNYYTWWVPLIMMGSSF